MELGQRLKHYRELNKVTQEEMAQYCSLSRNYISAVERGVNKCNANTLILYARKLHMSIDELAGESIGEGDNIDPELRRLIRELNDEQQQKVKGMIELLMK